MSDPFVIDEYLGETQTQTSAGKPTFQTVSTGHQEQDIDANMQNLQWKNHQTHPPDKEEIVVLFPDEMNRKENKKLLIVVIILFVLILAVIILCILLIVPSSVNNLGNNFCSDPRVMYPGQFLQNGVWTLQLSSTGWGLFRDSEIVWMINRDEVAYGSLTSQGTFELLNSADQVIYSTDIPQEPTNGPYCLTLLADGVVHIVSAEGTIVWTQDPVAIEDRMIQDSRHVAVTKDASKHLRDLTDENVMREVAPLLSGISKHRHAKFPVDLGMQLAWGPVFMARFQILRNGPWRLYMSSNTLFLKNLDEAKDHVWKLDSKDSKNKLLGLSLDQFGILYFVTKNPETKKTELFLFPGQTARFESRNTLDRFTDYALVLTAEGVLKIESSRGTVVWEKDPKQE